MFKKIRKFLLPVFLTAAALITASCQSWEKQLFLSLPRHQQIAVVNHLAGKQATDCYGAINNVFPAHLRTQARNIVHRESRNIPSAQNARSSAAGCAQIIKGTWNSNQVPGCPWSTRYNPSCNIRTMHNLYQRVGWSPWRL